MHANAGEPRIPLIQSRPSLAAAFASSLHWTDEVIGAGMNKDYTELKERTCKGFCVIWNCG
jgi:hypothetical protein